VYRKRISFVIPNGILLDRFKLINSNIREDLGLSDSKQYILFMGDKSLVRKNYNLVSSAYQLLGGKDIEILAPFPVKHDEVVKYFNAADVFAMPAFMEGSPNVIKEAMACNCPIVSTRVGDVEWVFGDTEGCYLSSFDSSDFAQKLKLALDFAEKKGRTNGRQRIIELGLDSATVAKRIIEVYDKVLKKN
jgi:glycosyltransferase involved in cell wall biosynthesis